MYEVHCEDEGPHWAVMPMKNKTPKGNIPLGRCRRRREGNIIIDPKEIGITTRNWVGSIQDRDY